MKTQERKMTEKMLNCHCHKSAISFRFSFLCWWSTGEKRLLAVHVTFCARSSVLQGFPTFGIKETFSLGITSQLRINKTEYISNKHNQSWSKLDAHKSSFEYRARSEKKNCLRRSRACKRSESTETTYNRLPMYSFGELVTTLVTQN